MIGDYEAPKMEGKWQKKWEENEVYKFAENDAKRKIYSLDTPPPFTSGDLHMGHVLSYAYFDFVARYKRMNDFNVYYPQGWDCQGFPTEVKVEAKFGRNLPAEKFRAHCVEWTGEYIKRMKGQMIALGYSPDWRFEYRTMSDDYHKRVQYSLLKMYEKAMVYRSEHPVFWCTSCGSAIAKAETEDLSRSTVLNYIKFVCGSEELIIATTRPELLHACVAVFVHPKDERYTKYVGKEVITPLGAKVNVIADDSVDMVFGTGIVMVCTFGDKTDVVWAYKHKLPIIKAMNERGKLLNAGEFSGLSASEGRAKIMEKLEAEGKVVKKEKLEQVVKVHDRCKKPIEFILSMQWFIKLKGFEKEIIDAAKSMKWVPEFTIQYLIDWTNFIEWDWVISRQRVFGTPIPFWYCEKCGKTVSAKYEELPVNPPEMKEKICSCGGKLTPEKNTCDCWVDSSISPLVIGGWPDNEKLLARVYPASLRPQGTEIIRTWAFYTIFRCLKLTGKAPFKELLMNGNVLAPDGKKMSKSLGNIIPPDKLLIEYSADAIRQWAALSGALAKDRPFSYKDIQFAQSFVKKLWNASKLVEVSLDGFELKKALEAKKKGKLKLRATDKWILSRMSKITSSVTENYEGFEFHGAISAIHEFFWHEFCDYYLEAIKHRVYQVEAHGEESKLAAQYVLYSVLRDSLKLLAPIAPFVSEEIYQELFAKTEGAGSIHISAWPKAEKGAIDEESEKVALALNSALGEARKVKKEETEKKKKEMGESGKSKKFGIAVIEVCAPKEDAGRLKLVLEELKSVLKAKEIKLSEGKEKIEVKGMELEEIQIQEN
ncbi:MAG: valine--tRNA ligase [Candidatus Micrarchaeota archaeon]